MLKRKKKEKELEGGCLSEIMRISSAQDFHVLTECQEKLDSRKSVLVQFFSGAGLVCV